MGKDSDEKFNMDFIEFIEEKRMCYNFLGSCFQAAKVPKDDGDMWETTMGHLYQDYLHFNDKYDKEDPMSIDELADFFNGKEIDNK